MVNFDNYLERVDKHARLESTTSKSMEKWSEQQREELMTTANPKGDSVQ